MWGEFSGIGAATYASSISYYMFLSLVPLLAICIALVSLMGIDRQVVYDLVAPLIPDAMKGFVVTLLSDAYERSGLAFSLSTVSLLWSASKGAKALRVGLNAVYAEQETRGAVAVVIISILAVLSIGVLFAGTMWLIFGNSLLHALSQFVPDIKMHGSVLEIADLVATIVAGMLVLALCYAHLPAGRRSFRAQLPGAACALVGCAVISYGFRLYVDHFANYTVVYGSIATVAMLLLWMYLVFNILIAGGFMNRYLLEKARARGDAG